MDPASAGAAEERKRLVMSVEQHLLGPARRGAHERHPAVAQADMGDLHGRGHTVQDHDLMAPVEPVGLARIEAQRHIGADERRRPDLRVRRVGSKVPGTGTGPAGSGCEGGVQIGAVVRIPLPKGSVSTKAVPERPTLTPGKPTNTGSFYSIYD